jgi:2-polyprenyl-3-methyl-5-hydroxy-6-metoxy-1,4-benzoquinol methylase
MERRGEIGGLPSFVMNFSQSIAKWIVESGLFAHGRRLWEKNQQDIELPNREWSKWKKLYVGGYLILRDYAAGLFPPRFPDRLAVYADEARVVDRPGATVADQLGGAARKPFQGAFGTRHYMSNYGCLLEALETRGIHPPQRLLELGCGPGWLSEWLALNGYDVTATSVRAEDRELVECRAASIRIRGLPCQLEFRESPMETIDQCVRDAAPFQAVFVHEALHHAFSWVETIQAVHALLPPGGWFFICNEPNILHTFISYRVATIQRWHEVGISRPRLLRELRARGFDRIDILRHRINTLLHSHWIAARRC